MRVDTSASASAVVADSMASNSGFASTRTGSAAGAAGCVGVSTTPLWTGPSISSGSYMPSNTSGYTSRASAAFARAASIAAGCDFQLSFPVRPASFASAMV